jgi:hypothetical protein
MGVEFLATAANRLHAQPADCGHEPIAPMPDLLGFQRHHPAALLLVQAAQQEVELMMQLPIRVVFALQANWALALMNILFRHRLPPSLENEKALYQIL